MKRTRIKICGITCAEDAAETEQLGVDALGFNFHPASKRYVEPDMAARIVRGLSPFVTSVGLFVDRPEADVRGIMDTVALDMLQFHGSEPEDYCAGFGRPYIKAIRADSTDSILAGVRDYPSAALLLFDTASAAGFGGTGETFDWHLMPELRRPYLLAGGLTPENVASAITQLRPYGVDVSSGVEVNPGRKDAGRLGTFFKAVTEADATGTQ